MAESTEPSTEQPDEHGSDHDDGYTGPATIVLDDEEIPVEVRLDSRHEPFDGRLHWSGRVLAQPRLTELVGDGSARVLVRARGYEAHGRLAEPDPWSRYRLTGVGRPPFALDEPPEPD